MNLINSEFTIPYTNQFPYITNKDIYTLPYQNLDSFSINNESKYKDYIVHDIDIEMNDNDEPILSCLLTVPTYSIKVNSHGY